MEDLAAVLAVEVRSRLIKVYFTIFFFFLLVSGRLAILTEIMLTGLLTKA